MGFGDRDKSYIRWRLEMVGGYDKQGNVFSIARPLTGSVSFPVKSFPDADALKQFINEFVFFRYGGCCPTWRSVLRESDCFSDEERDTGTLRGKSYTPEGGKDYVIQLVGSGELVVHRTGSWLQPHERNHHLPWPKSGTKKEEFLPPSRPATLGPHEEPGYVPPPRSPVELKTSGDMNTMEDESVGPNNIKFNSQADPLLDSLGPAQISHPAEYRAIINKLEANNVSVKIGGDSIAFSPNPAGGSLGNEILLPEKFSISALRHESGHFFDHKALGFPRYIEYFKKPELILSTERRQYLGEIRTARDIGDINARKTLIQNYLNEKNYIIDMIYQRPYGGNVNTSSVGGN